ncbi:cell division protein PerM [Streptomyces sanyensis]
MTDQSARPQTGRARQGASCAVAACVRGVVAAGLGLGLLTVLVTVLWISSPYPDGGSGTALRTAGALWLLAHGTDLVRSDTLSGTPAPMGLAPLLLLALPGWLVHRAARDALEPAEGHPEPAVPLVVGGVVAGYVLVGTPLAFWVAGGQLAADPAEALAHLALLASAAALLGAWAARGRPLGPAPAWLPRRVRVALARSRSAVVLRSAAEATLVLVGGGAVLVLTSLVWHGGAAREAFLGLAGDWSGRAAVGLLALALLPNAAVWGAAYALGPGFALGAGATATPLGLTGTPAVPDFPLLAAAPGPGPGTALHAAAVSVPLAAGLLVAWRATEGAAPRYGDPDQAWTVPATVLAVVLGALGCGAATALLAAAAGGPLGSGRLAVFGPVWWLVGGAAALWTASVALPVTLAVRAWRVRSGAGGGAEPEGGGVSGDGQGAVAPAPSAAGPAVAAVPGEGRDDGPLEDLDDDLEPYDFLPLDAWAERAAAVPAPPPSAVPSGPVPPAPGPSRLPRAASDPQAPPGPQPAPAGPAPAPAAPPSVAEAPPSPPDAPA